MQKITPFIWFDHNAEEAVAFYTSIFKNSKPGNVARYGDAGPGPEGSVMTVSFEIEGQEFIALNGGPMFKLTPAISFVVNCATQVEVDYYWDKLSAGGEKQKCGWVQDKFGLSWQIVPAVLPELLAGADTRRSNRVMKALLDMQKLEIHKLLDAYEGNPNS